MEMVRKFMISFQFFLLLPILVYHLEIAQAQDIPPIVDGGLTVLPLDAATWQPNASNIFINQGTQTVYGKIFNSKYGTILCNFVDTIPDPNFVVVTGFTVEAFALAANNCSVNGASIVANGYLKPTPPFGGTPQASSAGVGIRFDPTLKITYIEFDVTQSTNTNGTASAVFGLYDSNGNIVLPFVVGKSLNFTTQTVTTHVVASTTGSLTLINIGASDSHPILIPRDNSPPFVSLSVLSGLDRHKVWDSLSQKNVRISA